MQAVSELIKRIAFLRGLIPDPTLRAQVPSSAEAELAEFIAEEARRPSSSAAKAGADDANSSPRTWRRSCSRSLVVFLLFGYPVAFSLAACGLFFGFVGVEIGVPCPRR